MNTGLITEGLDYWFEATPEQIQKSKEKHGGRLILETCLQRSDTKNQMGRVYPHKILQREFENFQKAVDGKYAYGEMDHPSLATVNFANTCLIVDKQYWKKNEEHKFEWWGDIEILNNSKGKDLAAIIEQGKRVSVSSRGVGSVEYNKGLDADEVQDDFLFLCVDAVTAPSTKFANMIIKEGFNLEGNKEAHKRYIELKMEMLNKMDLINRGR